MYFIPSLYIQVVFAFFLISLNLHVWCSCTLLNHWF